MPQVLDNGRRLHLADAADATKQAFSGVAKGISSAFMLPLQTLQSAFKLAPPALPDRAERQPVRIERQPVSIERQPKGTSTEAGPPGATVTIRVRTSENGSHEASAVEGRMAGATSYIHWCFIYSHSFVLSCPRLSLTSLLHPTSIHLEVKNTVCKHFCTSPWRMSYFILSDPCTLLLGQSGLASKCKGPVCSFAFIQLNASTQNMSFLAYQL